ncbi:gamma-glutamyl-gamma-aminobutyrate hydrolase family protein [Enterococcus gilvus]|uniref:gamma-glutamyl-gamma-aminobutyrate hydrolase family protein n=1 Tax=Enterococcus gilvus TaxID=160453 RepID=UPI001C8CAE9B|nr:gamma-glutamyl-gamma-aminobutyrate hydrolase family protein [Enterococcus gilvus]MBX8939340.1 gamma-glutamyl-gamma-aminobutyrate hydrolase family protein [Enterococcus gilvus]
MKKNIIGIAANQHYQNNQDFFDQQFTYSPQGFIDGVHQAGGLPILLPISDPELASEYIASIDKLLLAGGQDVTPFLYNEEPHPKLGPTSIDRDTFEMALIKEAIKQNKPILTVCRGTQLLNVTLGGTLYQDLAQYPDWEVKHDMFPTVPDFGLHSITVKSESTLAPLFGERAQVNSYHHQAIKDLAESLVPIAWAHDGIIEAVESREKNTKILGVQWHPELTHKNDSKEQSLFDYFVQNFE